MSRATPDQIIAHVDLLRAIDGLLTQAEAVREKREALDRLASPEPTDKRCQPVAVATEGHSDG